MTNAWIESQHGPLLEQIVERHGDALKERHHTDDVHFAIWMHALDRAVQNRVMVSYDDLEDWAYRDAYDAGETPKEAAIQMLIDNGWDSAFDVGEI